MDLAVQGLNMNAYVYKSGGDINAQNSGYVHHPRERPYIYDLRFVIIHAGTTTNGHYECFTMVCNGKCSIFSVRTYKSCNKVKYKQYFGDNRSNKNAYILGYVKRSNENNFLFTNSNGNNEFHVNEPINNHVIIGIDANVIFILSLQLIIHMEVDNFRPRQRRKTS